VDVNTKEQQDKIQPRTPSTGRLVSLDVFRGITILGMILVNNPGTWSHVYPPLRHAEWHGCTFTDLIFPFFLFIVGTAMTFSFAKYAELGDNRRPLIKKIILRTLILFALGLLLNWFPYFDVAHGRIPGVWTVSYVFFTAGLALHVLAMCYWLIDLKGFRRWALPFVIFGINAIFVYVLSSLAAKLMKALKLQSWLYRNLFQSWAGDINGSLAFAVTYVLIWLGVTYILYRKRILIKV
jgi:predicted acyltransferase